MLRTANFAQCQDNALPSTSIDILTQQSITSSEGFVSIQHGISGNNVIFRIKPSNKNDNSFTHGINLKREEFKDTSSLKNVYAEENKMDKLIEMCEFENKDEVIHYLESNKDLVPIISEGIEEIKKIFNTNIEIKLSKIYDCNLTPEESIMAYICSDLSIEEALDKLDKVEDEWFLINAIKFKRRFNIDVSWK